MFLVLQNVIHPVTRETVLSSGQTIGAADFLALLADLGFDASVGQRITSAPYKNLSPGFDPGFFAPRFFGAFLRLGFSYP